MSVDNKRILSMIVDYTLISLALISAGFFIYCLIIKDVALWTRIVYFIWIGFVIGAIIFDIVCTNTKEGKQISGLIIYALSVLAVIVMAVLYFINSGMDGLATNFFNLFISISLISIMTTGYMIASWCVGEALVEHASAEREMLNRETRQK